MNYFGLGFGAIAIGALGVIDYANQASAAGQTAGEFSAGAYFASYGARIEAVRTARAEAAEADARDARRRAGARPYLPEAPAGWSRRSWAEGDNSAILLPEMPDDFGGTAPQILKNMAASGERAATERRNDESWVYEREGQIVALRATYVGRDDKRTIAGAAVDAIAAGSILRRAEGWAMIGGAAYELRRDPAAPDPDAPHISRAGTPFLSVEAHVGLHDEVRLSAQTNAPEDVLRAILAQIDYDGVNGLLTYPLPYIGKDAPEVPREIEPQLATKMLTLRQDILHRRSKAALNWLEEAASPENAMRLALNELSQGWNMDAVLPFETQTDDLHADAADADGTGSAISALGGMVFGRIFGAKPEQPAETAPRPAPKRLTLSGGASCLEGSGGHFCRD